MTDGCFNMIRMSRDLHYLWSLGKFALRPVAMSDDNTSPLLEFYWRREYQHTLRDTVDLTRLPHSSFNLTSFTVEDQSDEVYIRNNSGTVSPIRPGDRLVLHTRNPERHITPKLQTARGAMAFHENRVDGRSFGQMRGL